MVAALGITLFKSQPHVGPWNGKSGPTHAHGLVLRSLEAVVADALVTSLQINAQAMTADVGNFQAFIAI